MNPNPYMVTLTPAAAGTTGIATGLTGAGPFTTFTAAGPNDGLAHGIALASTANLSGITMTITGTDANGNALTSTMAGPNNNTVTGTVHFATVTRISAGATLGANTMNVGWGVDAVTPWYGLEYSIASFLAAVAAILTTGTATFNIEHTYDARAEAAVAFVDVTGATTNQEFAYNSVTRATRLHITAQSGAVFNYRILQGLH